LSFPSLSLSVISTTALLPSALLSVAGPRSSVILFRTQLSTSLRPISGPVRSTCLRFCSSTKQPPNITSPQKLPSYFCIWRLSFSRTVGFEGFLGVMEQTMSPCNPFFPLRYVKHCNGVARCGDSKVIPSLWSGDRNPGCGGYLWWPGSPLPGNYHLPYWGSQLGKRNQYAWQFTTLLRTLQIWEAMQMPRTTPLAAL
jgi:hypothetical protein